MWYNLTPKSGLLTAPRTLGALLRSCRIISLAAQGVLTLLCLPGFAIGQDAITSARDRIEGLERAVDEARESTARAVKAYEPKAKGRLDDSDTPVESLLRQLPGVVEVNVPVALKQPQRRIVHLKDWHLVPRDLFAADIRDQAEGPVSEAEIDNLYEAFLLEVELVRIEQKAILRCLIQHHGLGRVFQEGLTQQDLPIYRAAIKALQDVGALSDMEEAGKGESAEYRRLAEIMERIEGLLHAHRVDLLRIGAAGQL